MTRPETTGPSSIVACVRPVAVRSISMFPPLVVPFGALEFVSHCPKVLCRNYTNGSPPERYFITSATRLKIAGGPGCLQRVLQDAGRSAWPDRRFNFIRPRDGRKSPWPRSRPIMTSIVSLLQAAVCKANWAIRSCGRRKVAPTRLDNVIDKEGYLARAFSYCSESL